MSHAEEEEGSDMLDLQDTVLGVTVVKAADGEGEDVVGVGTLLGRD